MSNICINTQDNELVFAKRILKEPEIDRSGVKTSKWKVINLHNVFFISSNSKKVNDFDILGIYKNKDRVDEVIAMVKDHINHPSKGLNGEPFYTVFDMPEE